MVNSRMFSKNLAEYSFDCDRSQQYLISLFERHLHCKFVKKNKRKKEKKFKHLLKENFKITMFEKNKKLQIQKIISNKHKEFNNKNKNKNNNNNNNNFKNKNK